MFKDKLDDLRSRVERDTTVPFDNDKDKEIETLKTKVAFLEAEKGTNDLHRKYDKLQKDLDNAVKEKNRLK